MKIWSKDENTGISCGVNDEGELFLGDDRSGYNLPDTNQNRQYIINDFYRHTGKTILFSSTGGYRCDQ